MEELKSLAKDNAVYIFLPGLRMLEREAKAHSNRECLIGEDEMSKHSTPVDDEEQNDGKNQSSRRRKIRHVVIDDSDEDE